MSKASKYAEQVRSGAVLSLPNLATFIEEQQARLDAAEAELRQAKIREKELRAALKRALNTMEYQGGADLVVAAIRDGLARSGAET